jgi:hypothetical protein
VIDIHGLTIVEGSRAEQSRVGKFAHHVFIIVLVVVVILSPTLNETPRAK